MGNTGKGFWKTTFMNFFRNLPFLSGDTFNRQANGELHRRNQNLKKLEKERKNKS